MKTELVTIIIPTYNRIHLLNTLLESIKKQTHKKLEIILIDDASTDDTSLMIQQLYPSIKLIINHKNRGPSFSKNQGIKKSKGKYLLFLDSDVILHKKNSIKTLLKHLQDYPKIGVIGGEIDPQHTSQAIGKNFKNYNTKNCKFENVKVSKQWPIRTCDYVPFSNAMIQKKGDSQNRRVRSTL